MGVSDDSGPVDASVGDRGLWGHRVAVVAVVLLVVGPLVGGPAAGTPATASSIDECTTIEESGTYTITEDLESSDGPCIRIHASDVTVDGAGHTVDGTRDGAGIRTAASGVSNVTVADVRVTDWLVGVQFRNVDGGSIENVTATRNTNGFGIRESRDVSIAGVTATENGHQGIRLIRTNNSTVTESAAVENTADGVLLKTSTDNELSDNVASRNGDDVGADGFLIRDGSHRTDILRNEANENTDDGFDIQNSSRNTVLGNNASYNVGVVNSDGIEIRYSHRNVIRDNTANNNVDDGIDLQVANNNTVVDNVANRNVNDGIPLAHAHNNSVRQNVANRNSKANRDIVDEMLPGKEIEESGSDGLTIRSNSTDNVLARNTAKGNHRQGIRVWHHARSNVVRNNTAIDNRNDGIAVLNSTDNRVEHNEIRGNRANGIHLNNGAADNVLYENRVRENRLSGILAYTADGTRAVGNVVTGNAEGPRANGIRVGESDGAVLVLNTVTDNGSPGVHVLDSAGLQLVKPGSVQISDSEDVTIVRSFRLTRATKPPYVGHPDRWNG